MRLKGFQMVKKQHKDSISVVGKLNWLFIVVFSFLTKLAIKFHTNPYILLLKWSAREPGFAVQQLRELVLLGGYLLKSLT